MRKMVFLSINDFHMRILIFQIDVPHAEIPQSGMNISYPVFIYSRKCVSVDEPVRQFNAQ